MYILSYFSIDCDQNKSEKKEWLVFFTFLERKILHVQINLPQVFPVLAVQTWIATMINVWTSGWVKWIMLWVEMYVIWTLVPNDCTIISYNWELLMPAVQLHTAGCTR